MAGFTGSSSPTDTAGCFLCRDDRAIRSALFREGPVFARSTGSSVTGEGAGVCSVRCRYRRAGFIIRDRQRLFRDIPGPPAPAFLPFHPVIPFVPCIAESRSPDGRLLFCATCEWGSGTSGAPKRRIVGFMPRGFDGTCCGADAAGSWRTDTIFSISFCTQRSHSAARSSEGCCEKIRSMVFESSRPTGSITVRVMNGSRAGVVPLLQTGRWQTGRPAAGRSCDRCRQGQGAGW